MSDEENVQLITPPNTLKMKVREGGAGAVDLAAIERAEAVIAGLADSYLEWVEEDLVKISEAHETLLENKDDPTDYVDAVFQIAHDMKGQGGSFNYDLMTILGNDLCRFIEGKTEVSETDLDVISLYIDTMKIVIAKRMSGDGGAEGQKVLSGLAMVVKKITGGS
ncbi:MAG TPA: phosphorelay protein [Rhodospirillales bacterium]|nr:phosphorelay protein [Rhodospirillales bacterium]